VIREPGPRSRCRSPVFPPVEQSVAEVPESLPDRAFASLGRTAYERQVAAGAALPGSMALSAPRRRVARLRGRGPLPPADVARRTP